MKSIKNVLLTGCVLVMLMPGLLLAQSGAVTQVKLSRFEMQSSAVVTASGETLSSAGYVPANYWFPVTVPATVLTGLVANHV
ncbi:MAG TPA: hypothetical protein VFX43_06400, partial [Chitinophagaceae bacterium]|nr:hypothetical protein [Chitinophagaceae bacterium]